MIFLSALLDFSLAHRLKGGGPVIDHVVMVVMENLTFDALFGSDATLVPEILPPCGPGYGRACCNGHDQALAGMGGPFCRCSVPAPIAAWYRNFLHQSLLLTHCFSAVRGPSIPNHLMLMCGQSPFINDVAVQTIPPLFSIAERMEQNGLSWRNYSGRTAGGLGLLPQLRHRKEQKPWTDFQHDAESGRLPHLSWVIPPFALSQHPPLPWRWGTAFLTHILHAVFQSPLWPTLLVIIVWDDWGGYYDHMTPPIVERWQDGSPFRDGYRVPAFLISPWVDTGTCDIAASSLSLLKLIEHLFNLKPLTFRDETAPALHHVLSSHCREPESMQRLPLPPECLIQALGYVIHQIDRVNLGRGV